MVQHSFERTTLWKSSLAKRDNEEFSSQRDRLRTQFLTFRDRVAMLVSRIAAQLPNLTLHDISHLDALWETADLIAGSDYPLNPLEGFILGGAILLHDAATCFEAFEGGADEVRATTAWKDAFAAECACNDERSEPDLQSAADFSALRQLHSEQAEKLPQREWKHPDTGNSIFLIDDQHLRQHLGPLIGKIANSHHWDIERVGTGLRDQVNAPGEFPPEWKIDPIKIACLLRCADALHINNERAPDFLYALLKRRGISFLHWQAQNRLSHANLDSSDSATILITSTHPFPEESSDSWWIAFDAVCLADREIRSSNALLESRKVVQTSPPFQIRRIKGTEAPERMAEHIETEGWNPCPVNIHVSNVEKLVTELGGKQLYGEQVDFLEIALRELIQNARDSVRARQAIEPNNYTGKVFVRLHQDNQNIYLTVEDDGLGMSLRVLAGPLLDFGSSFWASSLVRSEFPGLLASGYCSVGRFGIGFYSVFMIADRVVVTTRRWDEGLDQKNQLIFKNGVTLRPVLKSGRIEGFPATISTRISLRLKKEILNNDQRIEIKRNLMHSINFKVPFTDYLAAIVAGLDVSVIYIAPDGSQETIHSSNFLDKLNREAWLRKISFCNHQDDDSLDNYISSNIQRLRPIVENGIYYGLAAISTRSIGQDFLSIATIGGLSTTIHQRSSDYYIGYIDYKPRSAKRDQDRDNYSVSENTINLWAIEQLELLKSAPINIIEQCFVAYGLTHFNIDPSGIARIRIVTATDGKPQTYFLTFFEVLQLLNQMDIAIFRSRGLSNYVEMHHNIPALAGYALILPIRTGEFNEIVIESGIPKNNFSIIDCLHRTALSYGINLSWRVEENVIQSYWDMMDIVIASAKPS